MWSFLAVFSMPSTEISRIDVFLAVWTFFSFTFPVVCFFVVSDNKSVIDIFFKFIRMDHFMGIFNNELMSLQYRFK